jgi:tRNA dimethylallyltransferase
MRAAGRVVGIFGPTASGKSAVAEALAELVPAELISADAMQVYAGVPILTNQSPARLVGIWPLDHEASVGEYAVLAQAAIDETLATGRTAIIVGGTGLYFRAALADLELPPAPDPALRERLSREYDELGPEQAHALLAERDPRAAARVHANDRRRIVRALELAELGRSLVPDDDRLWGGPTRHPSLLLGLDLPREVIAARIEARTRAMFDAGVEAEVSAALAQPLSSTAEKILGLREVAELPRAEAIAAIAQRTRRYAAYQRKWMRRIPGLEPLDATRPADELAAAIAARLAAEPGE